MSESENHPASANTPHSSPLEYARPEKRKPTGVPNIIAWPIVGVCLAGLTLAIFTRFQNNPYSRAAANRVKSASNLKQIGLAMQMYANDHNHAFPDSMRTILATEDLTPDVFVSPSSNDTYTQRATTQAVLADFAKPGHCSYLYFGSGLLDNGNPTTITACEMPGSQSASGMNVLFLNGHVEFIGMPVAQQLRTALASGGPIAWTSTGGITRPAAQPTTRP